MKADLSDESIEEAYHFLRAQINRDIDHLHAELRALATFWRMKPDGMSAMIIALAQRYRNEEGFQQRWSLEENK